jgi:hypothetical protein
VQRVFDQLESFARTFITLTPPNVDVRSLEHKQILDALKRRDPKLASDRARRPGPSARPGPPTRPVCTAGCTEEQVTLDLGTCQRRRTG